MILVALAAAFVLAMQLSMRGLPLLKAVPLAALAVPAAILFQAFIYPGDPELSEAWVIAVLVGLFFGLLAATPGFYASRYLQDQRKP